MVEKWYMYTCSSVVWYCHFWVHEFLTLTYLATLFIYFCTCGDANSSNNNPQVSVNICFEYLWYYALFQGTSTLPGTMPEENLDLKYTDKKVNIASIFCTIGKSARSDIKCIFFRNYDNLNFAINFYLR